VYYRELNLIQEKEKPVIERNEFLDSMGLVTEIVASYVSKNEIDPSELSSFIQTIHRSLCNINTGHSFLLNDRPEPVVSVEASVQPDYIVCLEDGARLKMLKRHLKTSYNMTPEQYRERWDLPADYPMVAPNYAKRRSSLAKEIGLGKNRGRSVAA
jgi:predicted transcriptional regulator